MEQLEPFLLTFFNFSYCARVEQFIAKCCDVTNSPTQGTWFRDRKA